MLLKVARRIFRVGFRLGMRLRFVNIIPAVVSQHHFVIHANGISGYLLSKQHSISSWIYVDGKKLLAASKSLHFSDNLHFYKNGLTKNQ